MAGFAHILAVATDAHAVFQVEADNAELEETFASDEESESVDATDELEDEEGN